MLQIRKAFIRFCVTKTLIICLGAGFTQNARQRVDILGIVDLKRSALNFSVVGPVSRDRCTLQVGPQGKSLAVRVSQLSLAQIPAVKTEVLARRNVQRVFRFVFDRLRSNVIRQRAAVDIIGQRNLQSIRCKFVDLCDTGIQFVRQRLADALFLDVAQGVIGSLGLRHSVQVFERQVVCIRKPVDIIFDGVRCVLVRFGDDFDVLGRDSFSLRERQGVCTLMRQLQHQRFAAVDRDLRLADGADAAFKGAFGQGHRCAAANCHRAGGNVGLVLEASLINGGVLIQFFLGQRLGVETQTINGLVQRYVVFRHCLSI